MKQTTPSALIDAALVARFEELVGDAATFAEREARALDAANRLVREVLRRELERMAKGYADEVLVDGVRHRRHSAGVRTYHSLCGPIPIRRDTYRRVGVHNGPTVVPLEIEAGLLEKATPGLANSVVQAFAMMPLRHYEAEMRAAHRTVPSRSTLERIGKRVGATLREDAPVIEPVVRRPERVPKAAVAISVGLDRTTIPMSEYTSDAPMPMTASHVRRRPPRTTVAYRMAYVATLAMHDASGDALTSVRITAAAHEGATELMGRLGDELQHLLKQRPRLPVVVVQDGAPELWNLITAWLSEQSVQPSMTLIDRYHVDERLARCAEAVTKNAVAAGKLLSRWRGALDRSDAAITHIYKELDRRLYAPLPPGTKRNQPWYPLWYPQKPRLAPERARVVEENINYFRRNRDRICYAKARRKKFPLGSGVTEGACKSTVAVRFKRSGQRWGRMGVSPCLYVRTLVLNERLESSLALLVERQQERLQS